MKVKICGIRNEADARVAINAGANALGFLVGLTHKAEDGISVEVAKAIIEGMPPLVSSVMVTHLTEVEEIVSIAREIKANTIQVHDYVKPEILTQIRDDLPAVKLIKAIPIVGESEALEFMNEFQDVSDALLLDTVTKDRIGGTGKTHDWRISSRIVKEAHVPVFLAGGLEPLNVAEAISAVSPYGVDVNSGVEIEGDKDELLTRAFVANATLAS